jgi:hypothetical protein
MHYSSRPPYADTLSLTCRAHLPISAGKLVSLIDLGWSDNRIACYFGVAPLRVSALRAYYGLIDQAQDSWVCRMRRRNRLESQG